MHNGDVLGDEGRKALNACVKVKIFGKPETRRYDYGTAQQRLWRCYAPIKARDFRYKPSLPDSYEEGRTYDILDIHDAVVKFDERRCVEKYPREGPGSDKMKDLIDRRRADVERELEEDEADPDGRHKYSWVVAQRRVRDCFAGNFAEDHWPFRHCEYQKTSDIIEIHDLFTQWDEKRERADAQRATLAKEYDEAVNALKENKEATLRRYSHSEAEMYMQNCYYNAIPYQRLQENSILPVEFELHGLRDYSKKYINIFDIHKAFLQFDGRKLLQKYPKEGPGSEELKSLIDKHRDNLEKEYQKATCDTGSPSLCKYSQSEVEHRVRECFAGVYLGDTEIFPMVSEDESPQNYDIFDIKRAIDSFDAKTFADVSKYESEGEPSYSTSKQKVDEQRADIQREYELATSSTEIEHGSGFIVHNHFIITNKHVIETYLNETESHEIHICNTAIGELACKVAHYDAGKDLALLYCPDLNLEQSGICPLHLSNQPLLPGISIFTFGYPMSHTGETALFVSGNVSGSKRTLAGHSMVVLNCSLNSGNSGGPVLCCVKDQLRVVGVATQKHFKEILTFEERETIEHIRESLQIHAISDVPDDFVEGVQSGIMLRNSFSALPTACQNSMFLLTLKLYDALETHSQFNLSNALPGHLVVEFIENTISKYTGEYKEELAEIVKLSERSC